MKVRIFEEFPTLEFGKYILRELRRDDAKSYFHYLNHPEVYPFIADSELPKSEEEAVNEIRYWFSLFRTQRSIFWGIAHKNNPDLLIGTIGFNTYSEQHKRADISYDLAYDYWGRGIMSQAMDIAINFAVSKMHVHRIQAHVAVNNNKSVALLSRCGFKNEGKLEKYGIIKGVALDYFMYARVF